MNDLYLLATVRMRELQCDAELGGRFPGRMGRTSRFRIRLAEWLIAAGRRLWPEAGRTVTGETR